MADLSNVAPCFQIYKVSVIFIFYIRIGWTFIEIYFPKKLRKMANAFTFLFTTLSACVYLQNHQQCYQSSVSRKNSSYINKLAESKTKYWSN